MLVKTPREILENSTVRNPHNRGPPQDNRGPPQDHRGAHGAPYGNQRRHNASSAISAGQWGNHR